MSISHSSDKVIPRILGGMGNQLFIYAAARRLALMNDAELVLDNVSGFLRDLTYHRRYQLDHFNIHCRKATTAERMEPLPRPRRRLKRWWNQRKPFTKRQYISQEEMDFDPRLLTIKPRGTLYLEGYWQSEDYFKDVAHVLRQDLRIQPPKDRPNQQMAAAMRQYGTVAVHVRFFDEPDAAVTHNTPTDYYHRAITAVEQQITGAHYFVFSDCPEAARSHIPLPDDRITLVYHNQGEAMAYADLWLMTQCQHFIIANSTFSWWGAWLGELETTLIFCPAPERYRPKNAWQAKGMIPERWTLV